MLHEWALPTPIARSERKATATTASSSASADGTTANGSGFQTYQVMPCLIDVATIEEVAGTPSLRKLTALKGD